MYFDSGVRDPPDPSEGVSCQIQLDSRLTTYVMDLLLLVHKTCSYVMCLSNTSVSYGPSPLTDHTVLFSVLTPPSLTPRVLESSSV